MGQLVKDRLIEFIKSVGLNVSQFEKKCGFANGYVRGIRQSISPQRLEQINNIYPELNTDWLITGKGQMIVVKMEDGKTGEESKVGQEVLMKALDEIAEQRKLVSRAQDQIDQLIQITKTMADAFANNNKNTNNI